MLTNSAAADTDAPPPTSSSPNRPPEVVYLTDSDDDYPIVQQPPQPPRSVPLQSPFDPTPRSAPNGSSPASAKPPPPHRASAAPTIASLINTEPPPKKSKSSHPSPSNSTFFTEINGFTSAKTTKPSDLNGSAPAKSSNPVASPAAVKNNQAPVVAAAPANLEHSPKAKPGSSAVSPKPVRQNAPPAPPATSSGGGGGLLGDVFQSGAKDSDEMQPPNIFIDIPLNGETNKYINFAKISEDRYGWAALNPRLAKAKAHVDSGDEMMMDGSESESNVEMGGDGEKKRTKRRYQDVYDKEDPFIDDSEMLWEEQAAASKDGFFVYSGPLVPEGEKPQIERYVYGVVLVHVEYLLT